MKKIFYILIILGIFFTLTPDVKAFSGRISPAAYVSGRTRYMPGTNMYRNNYMNQKRYIYSPQQARYNGYRTGIQGNGYNNTYYYNRYRR